MEEEYPGQVVVAYLWAAVFILADVDFWLVLLKVAGVL